MKSVDIGCKKVGCTLVVTKGREEGKSTWEGGEKETG